MLEQCGCGVMLFHVEATYGGVVTGDGDDFVDGERADSDGDGGGVRGVMAVLCVRDWSP